MNNNAFVPLTRFPRAAYGMLGNLCLRIARLEEQASEARTQNVRRTNLKPHPATERLLDELEFLHASHARALRGQATALSDECAETSNTTADHAVEPPSEAGSPREPEEVVIALYAQLNELAANYTRLHALALAFEHRTSAELALNHLRAITPKIMVCSQAIPLLTADQALRHFGHISPGCADAALEATQAAWKNETQFPATT